MEPNEKKAEPQAPAQAAPAEKVTVPQEPAKVDAARLRELYKASPQMFEEAGIVQRVEAKVAEKKAEPVPQSAAPAYAGKEIKLPTDVQVNRQVVDDYLVLAQKIGLSPEQVQAQLDFQVELARKAGNAQAKPAAPTQAEVDAANVAELRADKEFGGAAFDANMELARRGATKWADPSMLDKMKTSDPALVRHFWKIGKADAEDRTPRAPNRNGEEKPAGQEEQLKQRYPRTPQMFPGG